MFYENRAWNQRPDVIVINKNHRTVTLYILQFKLSSDRNEYFLGVKEDEANKQHKSIIKTLKARRLPPNGCLNRLILWQEGAVQ